MKNILCVILALSVIACKSSKSNKSSDNLNLNSNTKITYHTGACYGRCPIFTLEISGAIKAMIYKGEKNCEKLGTFTKTISDSTLNYLVSQFESAKFNSLNDEYLGNITDFAVQTLTYENDGKIKSIKIRSGAPPELANIQRNLMLIGNSDGWNKIAELEQH